MAGMLFLIYLGTIIYLTRGLVLTLRQYHDRSVLTLVWEAIWFSLKNIAILYFAVPAISIFAGSFKTPFIGIPKLSPAIPWSNWFEIAPINGLRNATLLSIWFSLFAIILIAILSMANILINPKNKEGIRNPRKQVLKESFYKIKKDSRRLITLILTLFLFLLAWNIITSLYAFIVTNKVVDKLSITSNGLSEEWLRYFASIVIVYGLAAVYLLFLSISHPRPDIEPQTGPMERLSLWVLIVAVAILAIVPIYAVGVYPHLPQQVGGGRLLRVDVITSSKELDPLFTGPDVETYLIDRTPNTSLFLLAKKNRKDPQIIEVPSSRIQSITYNPSP
jgi:heme/copper-type cytochrome/quinol oxidase subunit 2